MDVLGLAGVWRRQSIVMPDGTKDESSRCLALVTQDGWCGMIGLPEHSPTEVGPFEGKQVDGATAAALVRHRGWIGRLHLDDRLCRVDRRLDYQPPARGSDTARLFLQDDGLIEDGVQVAYRAVWWRALGPEVATATWEWHSEHAGPRVMMVIVGDRFLMARERRPPLPPHRDGLSGLLLDGQWAHGLRPLFDCEVSYGEWNEHGAAIVASTLPWREGMHLAPATMGVPFHVDALPPGTWVAAA